VENKEIDDQVLLKSDGFPTYHLANIVDDHAMQISHVFRAEEWLPSTPKHIILYSMFGWQPPAFAHLPMVLNKDRRKLSKRKDGAAVWISTYRNQGYLPQALVNYLAFMGWNPGDEREFFTMDQLIKEFSVERVHSAGAIFDVDRLKYINAHYLRQLTNDELVAKLRDGDFLSPDISSLDNRLLAKWVQISRERMQTLGEFENLVWPLVKLGDYPAERLIFKKSDEERTKKGLDTVYQILDTLSDSQWASINTLQEELAKAVTSGLTNGDVFWPTRVALSGQDASPSPAELLWVLDKEESLTRLQKALKLLDN
jgi:glutamyl-tRNA synthetase